MRTRTIRTILWMAMLVSTAAAAQPAHSTTQPGRAAVVDDQQGDSRLARSGVGVLPDSTGAQNAPRRMSLNPMPGSDDLQPNGPLRLIVMAGLILLAAGLALHAWHDSVTNHRML